MSTRTHTIGIGALRAVEAGADGVRAAAAPVQHHAAAAGRGHQVGPEDVRRELRVRARARRQLLPVAAVPPPPRAHAAALVTVPAGLGAPRALARAPRPRAVSQTIRNLIPIFEVSSCSGDISPRVHLCKYFGRLSVLCAF